MQSLFAEWYEHGGDWLQTSVMQEASRQKVDESRGTEKMTSWKALREKYGKKTAEKIRDNKKRLEAARDPKTEPRPFWFPHPEASEDPDTRIVCWEAFRSCSYVNTLYFRILTQHTYTLQVTCYLYIYIIDIIRGNDSTYI